MYGNSSGVTVGNDTLATYEYCTNNGKLLKINYGNGFSERYVYNTLEMLKEIWYTYDDNDETGVKAYSYVYNKDGSLAKFTNHLDGTSIEYEYDVHGRLISSVEINSSDTDYKNDYVIEIYDAEGRIRKSHNYVNYLSSSGLATVDLDRWYEFNTNGTLHREQLGYASTDSLAIDYSYDDFGRLTRTYRRAGDVVIDSTYTYVSDGTNTSNLIATYTNKVGSSTTTITYEYDSLGNIIKIVRGSNETTYTYDDLGQLKSERTGRITKNYTYDSAGNIKSIQTVERNTSGDMELYSRAGLLPLPTVTTVNLGYTDSDWGDLLTSYDGTAITYDAIGNPLSYYNGSAYTFTWTGRQLTTAVKGSTNMSFTYDDAGIRTSKTVNGVKHTYYLNGSQIVAEQWADKLLVFTYDASGSPIGMSFRKDSYAADQWDVYWFEKNLQGDITSLYNSSGVQVATYSYTTAWGEHSTYLLDSSEVGASYNPFRYRGYYYDTDLEMYYLQSRYYDAKICRFINADSALYHSMLGYNMFVYCENNPVNYYDPTGEYAYALKAQWFSLFALLDSATPIVEIILSVVAVSVAVAVIIDAAQNETPEKNKDKPQDAPKSLTESEAPQEVDSDAKSLPNQGSVTSVPGAPPVDAGKQGKHVHGHNNDTDPNKTKWPVGKNGVKETQEAWKNSFPHPKKPNTRIGVAGDGTRVEIKISKTGIHGYPIFP